MQQERFVYPFSAIVGQEQTKKALLLNAINPGIGGVLIRGEKGTAKSVAVRGLAQLLPTLTIVAGCPFSCDPGSPDSLCERCATEVAQGRSLEESTRRVSVVDLPVGATEDRVVGTLDIEKAIKEGEKRFEPGLLASANRGILYIDEVNLLDDHLVDVLLDAAAMGVNVVEREGVSFSHPAEFILVGTMNPEEGELRPQLLDRFGLAVEVTGIRERAARKEIVRRRIRFEEDQPAFVASWAAEQDRIREAVETAKVLLPQVTLSEEMLDLIAQICEDFGVDGHRADIVIHKAACTLCAYNGRTEVDVEDVTEAAELALSHRRRRQPFEDPGLDQQQLQESVRRWNDQDDPQDRQREEDQEASPFERPSPPQQGDGEGDAERFSEPDRPYQVVTLAGSMLDQVERSGGGRRSMSRTESKSGRYVMSAIPKGKVTDLALDATPGSAAPTAMLVETQDMRQKVREKKVGNVILFCLDTSGSMGAQERMAATKGAILSLLIDAYQRRDRVGLVVFRGTRAELVLGPTNSAETAQRHLAGVRTGGRTPLAEGLRLSMETLKRSLAGDKRILPLLVLVSDGRANVSVADGDPVEDAARVARQIRAAGLRSIVIDAERDRIKFGLARRVSAEMGGTYVRLEELKAEPIVSAVRDGGRGGRRRGVSS